MEPSGEVFRHGVGSGDPLTDRVVLWTRVTTPGSEGGPAGDPSDGDAAGRTGEAIEVNWTIARDSGLSDVVASGTGQAPSERDWTVHVDVTGLEPATTYWYAFSALGATSGTGRTKTLPGGDPEHLRIAMVSCAKFNAGFFNGYARIADRSDLDFVLHLGDYIYEMAEKPGATQTPGAGIGRPFEPPTECVTLWDYRTRYSQYRRDPDTQAMHAMHPVIATLDDHELADGAWREGSVEHRPERDGPWAARRAAAFRARWEWLPARPPDPNDPERVFRSVGLGSLADLFLIDTRSRRDAPVGGAPMWDPERTQLGSVQRAWLFDGLERSKATWRLLANSSVMGAVWHDTLVESARKPLSVVKLIGPDGTGPDIDQWDGYPAERRAILEHLRDVPVKDVVVLSGDVHVGLAIDLTPLPFDASEEPVAVEFVTSSLTSQNVDEKMDWEPRTNSMAVEKALVDSLPHLHWVDLDSHGYVVVDVDPRRVTAEWWLVDTVLKRSPNEHRGASWTVRHGQPGVVPTSEPMAEREPAGEPG